MKSKKVWDTIGLVLIFWPVVGFLGLIVFVAIKEADSTAVILASALASVFVGVGIMAAGEQG